MSSCNPEDHWLSYSGVESRRFDMRVFRGHLDSIDPLWLLAEVIEQEVDLAILRIPADKQHQLTELRKTGLPYIIADTLVSYSLELKDYMPAVLRNQDLVFSLAGIEDTELIENLVEKTFSDYTNHYTSNPYINKHDILKGYQEWAVSFLVEDDAKTAWLVQRGDKVIGFATCSQQGETGEGVLYGVVPEEAGRGVYSDIIRFTQQQFKARGLSSMLVVTQIQNLAVQRVWHREGFTLGSAEITIHINSLIHKAAQGEYMDSRFFSDMGLELVDRAEVASHQAKPNNWVIQHLCHGYHWANTEFVNCSGCLLQTLKDGISYRFQGACSFCNEDEKFYLSTIRISDTDDRICGLLYVETSCPPVFLEHLRERG